MDALAYDLKTICEHNRDGSFATQANRHRALQLIAHELKEMGFKLPAARSFKPKHVQKLIARWQCAELTAGTLKNRMGHLRWLLAKVNKSSILPRDNASLGIENRQGNGQNRAQTLDMDKLEAIPSDRVQASMKLMAAFGLRMEEALKFRPEMADKGDSITLSPSWTKGGRARVIPILTTRQRALLDEVKAMAGEESLIPPDKSYIQHRKAFEYQTLKAGFTNLHGLRHKYAQARYKSLTGWACPMAGGNPLPHYYHSIEAQHFWPAEGWSADIFDIRYTTVRQLRPSLRQLDQEFLRDRSARRFQRQSMFRCGQSLFVMKTVQPPTYADGWYPW